MRHSAHSSILRTFVFYRPSSFLLTPAMTLLSLTQTLTPPPLNPQIRNPNPKLRPTPLNAKVVERGVEFETGDSFFRTESAVGRDLAVLAAALHRKYTDCDLRILDAMCGCGVRATRYLAQAGAGFVWANDAFEGVRPLIVSNLSSISPEGEGKWVVTHCTANRLLTESYLKREYFDVVDVDSFGSESSFMRSAIMAVKTGGLLYLTCTDGFSSGGHRPLQSHALWSYPAPSGRVPFIKKPM